MFYTTCDKSNIKNKSFTPKAFKIILKKYNGGGELYKLINKLFKTIILVPVSNGSIIVCKKHEKNYTHKKS